MDPKRSPLDQDLTRAFQNRKRELTNIARKAGKDEASDLVQDAFLRTVEISKKEEVKEPLRLLYRIARNLVTDRLRTKAYCFKWQLTKVTV